MLLPCCPGTAGPAKVSASYSRRFASSSLTSGRQAESRSRPAAPCLCHTRGSPAAIHPDTAASSAGEQRDACRAAPESCLHRKEKETGGEKNAIYYQERKKPAHTKQQAHLRKQHKVSVKGMRLEFIRYTDNTQPMMLLPCIPPLPTQGEVSNCQRVRHISKNN